MCPAEASCETVDRGDGVWYSLWPHYYTSDPDTCSRCGETREGS